MAGVTDNGFVKKTFSEIQQEIEADLKTSFGNNIDLEASGTFGQFVGNQSKKFTNLWELLQAIYASFSPDTAEGVSLDNVCALVGIERLPATGSVVNVILYGAPSTLVSAGHIVQQQTTDLQLTSNGDVTIGLSVAADVDISVLTVSDTTLYTITINGTMFDYTSDASATAIEIIAGLKVEVDLGSEPVVFTDNLDGTANIQADDGETAFSLLLTGNLQADIIGTPSAYTMSTTGALAIPANTIDTIITSVAGLSSVNNLAAGLPGRDQESDTALRTRRRDSVEGVGNATDESIKTKLLQNVVGVTAVTVTSNRTVAVDSDGRPAKSFEAVVIGGVDQDIGDLIWLTQPSGIEPYGTTSINVIDSESNIQVVKFSRPDTVYIWFQVQITANPEELFPTDGIAQLQQAILEQTQEEFTIGKDVIREKFFCSVYSVSGIKSAIIEIGSSTSATVPPGSFDPVDIVISPREIALSLISNINVFF